MFPVRSDVTEQGIKEINFSYYSQSISHYIREIIIILNTKLYLIHKIGVYVVA